MKLGVFTTPWGAEIKAYSREGTIDWNTLQSCIVEDEYRVNQLPGTGIAIDLGGYIGGCSLALAAKGYKVFMVEPLPENIEVARKNIELNHFDITLIAKAVTTPSPEKEITIYYASPLTPLGKAHEFIGAIVPRLTPGITDGAVASVPKITLDEIFMQNTIKRCDFLKVDIEGSEWSLFRHISESTLSKIDRIAIEIDLPIPTSTSEFLPLLQGKFTDVSAEFFPKWSAPGISVHGYFMKKQ